MKKLVIAATISAGLMGLVGCSSDSSETDIVAETKVGKITKDEFYEELKDVAGESIMQNLIISQIFEDKYGKVTDKDIDNKIEELKAQYGPQYPMWLQQQGVTDDKAESFRKQIRFAVLQDKIMFDGVEVTDEEIEEAFTEMEKNNEVEIKASHILVEDEDEAKDIKKELDNGADFAELAKEHSIDGSAEKGGDLGFFAPTGMIAEFSEVAFSLDVDEISDLVETKHGYHIIKVTEIADLEMMKDDIRSTLRQEKALANQDETAEKIDKLIADSEIDIKIDEFKDLFKVDEPSTDKDEKDQNNDDKNDNNENNDENKNDSNENNGKENNKTDKNNN